MIPPTIGRMVWYRPNAYDKSGTHFQEPPDGGDLSASQPFHAMVVYVWDDRTVNLVGYDHNGYQFVRSKVQLLQDDDAPAEGASFCEWMPFQKDQAKRHEQIPQQEPARLTAPEKIS